jgi:hypothetical protein
MCAAVCWSRQKSKGADGMASISESFERREGSRIFVGIDITDASLLVR